MNPKAEFCPNLECSCGVWGQLTHLSLIFHKSSIVSSLVAVVAIYRIGNVVLLGGS